jgi:hypothetical protein
MTFGAGASAAAVARQFEMSAQAFRRMNPDVGGGEFVDGVPLCIVPSLKA